MKSNQWTMALIATCISAVSILGSASAHAAEKKTDAQRKEYLESQKKKIDSQAERRADKVRDGQKGMGNSGATQNKVDEINKERDERKKALDDHYKNNPQGKNR